MKNRNFVFEYSILLTVKSQLLMKKNFNPLLSVKTAHEKTLIKYFSLVFDKRKILFTSNK